MLRKKCVSLIVCTGFAEICNDKLNQLKLYIKNLYCTNNPSTKRTRFALVKLRLNYEARMCGWLPAREALNYCGYRRRVITFYIAFCRSIKRPNEREKGIRLMTYQLTKYEFFENTAL